MFLDNDDLVVLDLPFTIPLIDEANPIIFADPSKPCERAYAATLLKSASLTSFKRNISYCWSSVSKITSDEVTCLKSVKEEDDLSFFLFSLIEGGLNPSIIEENIFKITSKKSNDVGLLFCNCKSIPTNVDTEGTNKVFFVTFCSNRGLKLLSNLEYFLFLYGINEKYRKSTALLRPVKNSSCLVQKRGAEELSNCTECSVLTKKLHLRDQQVAACITYFRETFQTLKPVILNMRESEGSAKLELNSTYEKTLKFIASQQSHTETFNHSFDSFETDENGERGANDESFIQKILKLNAITSRILLVLHSDCKKTDDPHHLAKEFLTSIDGVTMFDLVVAKKEPTSNA